MPTPIVIRPVGRSGPKEDAAVESFNEIVETPAPAKNDVSSMQWLLIAE